MPILIASTKTMAAILIRLDRSLRVHLFGKTWIAAATSTLFASMLELIIADAPRMILCAPAGSLRAHRAPVRNPPRCAGAGTAGGRLVLAGCGLGIPGLATELFNFAALPISIGVGADYAANLWAACAMSLQARLLPRAIPAHAAVARPCRYRDCCFASLTTIIGYSSLLLSKSRALQSFGLRQPRRSHLPPRCPRRPAMSYGLLAAPALANCRRFFEVVPASVIK